MQLQSVITIIFLGFLGAVSPAVSQLRPPPVAFNLNYLRITFIQPGARPAALGGAFIGAAQDMTAATINPAGLTYTQNVEASLHQRLLRSQFKVAAGSRVNPNTAKKVDSNNFDQSLAGMLLPLRRVSLALFRQVVFDEHYSFDTRQFLSRDSDGSADFVLGGLGNFPGREVNFDLDMVHDAFSLAFALSKTMSVGATVRTSTVNLKFREQLFLDPAVENGAQPGGNSAQTLYSVSTVNERASKLSYTFGFMGNMLIDKLFVGAVVHLNPSYSLTSNSFYPEYRLVSRQFPAQTLSRSFRFSVPDSYGLGIYYLLLSRVRLSFDIVHIEYTDLLSGNELDVVVDGNMRDLTVKDATQIHAGMEWLFKVPQLGFTVPLRFGFYTEPGHRIHASGNNPDLHRLFPGVSDQVHFSFGLGATIKNNLKVDGSFVLSEDGVEFWGSTLLSVHISTFD